jgi:hypothetical protein
LRKKIEKKLLLCSWLLFISTLAVQATPSPAQEKAAGDGAYQQNGYSQALIHYEKAYRSGYYTEQMLYRLAFLYEQQHNYTQSVFYLKKAQQAFGNELLTAKIQQLIEAQNGITRIPPTYPVKMRVWIGLFYPYLVGLMLLCVCAAIFLALRPMRYHVGGVSALAAITLLVGGLLLRHELSAPHQAVVISRTSAYEMPSYAIPLKTTAPAPGATLTITGAQDIWYSVGKGRYLYWIPKKNVRDL